MKRSDDRILTTHVGSLVKTPEIIDAMRAEAMGEVGRRVLEQGRGATERTLKMLAPLLGRGVETAP